MSLVLSFLKQVPSWFLYCPLARLGWHCPTCGLGHALLELFRGNFAAAFHLQPVAYPFLFCSMTFIGLLLFKRPRLYSVCRSTEAWLSRHRALSYVIVLLYFGWGLCRAR